MRTDQPKMIYLKDYQAPEYLIDETHLTFELFEDHSLVHAQLVMRRNPARGAGLPPLVLDGQQLELLSVSLSDQALSASDYQLDDSHLTLHPTSASFTLDTSVRIHPESNTALEGLYKSSGMFCTQCEAEGFRKITYYLDRPDVMSKFTTTVVAEQHSYPVLLSNGNPIASGPGEDGRHWATWEDPFMKPAYLFALVAGDLWCVEDSFRTQSGRDVALRIYVEPENIDKCQHAMNSLKKSMRWDEETYGREYDLDIFMIVAVNDFNMGAMENKGLNIFNSSAVLARAETATDAAHQRVEAIVAHEYFHNWSGNRVTCRDWFQLSLKEGFTVFRDAGFSADMNSATVKRIQDVAYLRTHQFAEDAGPMAHAVRPESFIEISNFYTLTVYEKGSEVVGMIHTLLGAEGFRKGSDLYFERHDGQAVTCDDFVKAMEDANGVDLTQFKRWYSQAGTPRLAVSESYDAAAKTYSLTFRQSCPQTPDKVEKLPFVIPVALGLLDSTGADMALRLAGEAAAQGSSRVLSVTEAEQTFTFVDIAEHPLPSLLRGFSAPVKLSFPYNRDQLMFLMQHDSDGFNRWDAGQQLSVQVLQELIAQHQQGRALVMDERLVAALGTVLADDSLDQAMVAEMLSLPGEAYLTEISEVADVEAIHAAREFARQQLADSLFDALWKRYQANRQVSKATAYVAESEHFARRALQNIALSYLMLTHKPEVLAAAIEQFDSADNMTERLTALAVLVNSPFEAEKAKALEVFAENFKDNALVMDQWFSVQAGSPLPGGLERVKALMQHPAFNIKNPNKVRALVGAFAGQNLINFHAADGSGYRFLADLVIQLNGFNPQIASRQLAPLTRWRKYDSARQALMKGELERIRASGELSSDVFEVVSKSLA
ncbi:MULTISPECIES: aminopeptidase N [Pseudomonas]|jgi:aminopeptidase N|uniref:Aminopeptidase N n=1 Tax=Pseudomonas protegens (strain DSM 19095 / LMG 27888 / CFBP 6595 / CHA0) TaxID=1124983 RepID=A0A2C9EN88_PSEPH|nr:MULTISPECIES: aminopeptidase N [Pseudomonas]GED73487.1 aminopeptidase N [Pseudomonas fluorescens]AGL85081.1 aminopeptidase N [Pseudomonas protegens CHA0]AQT10161.1 aminopeptidase [Pseudomonas protegens]MBB1612662.1 aminopeptidase N [Pseudomonas sp. UMC65]MBB1622910.1 aminopeptidase N [Pseudomonas sp. UME65]